MSITKQRSVILDDRENNLYNELIGRCPGMALSKARLNAGDIHILENSDVLLVLERKSRQDLRASLIDGRFHAQRSRMTATYGKDTIGFVIEGGTSWADAESGAEVAVLLRDRLPLFWTASVGDTADLVSRLLHSDMQARPAPPGGVDQVRTALATTASPERSLSAMLRCIPGISARRAQVLASMFGSMANLTEEFRQDVTGTLEKIACCRGSSTGSRFGLALAQRTSTCLGVGSRSHSEM